MMMQEWFSEGFPVQVPAGTSILDAEMQVPSGANGLIVLVHAGSRPRFTQRVQNLAEYFTKDGFGILIMDLLTEEESEISKRSDEIACFDREMLADRLDNSLEWVRDLPEASGLPIGLFGTGDGAWAAFSAAASRPADVSAIVAAGMATPADARMLKYVRAPAMLIADDDGPETDLARECLAALPGRKRMELVTGYAKGREEARVTEKVSRLACFWFEQYLQ